MYNVHGSFLTPQSIVFSFNYVVFFWIVVTSYPNYYGSTVMATSSYSFIKMFCETCKMYRTHLWHMFLCGTLGSILFSIYCIETKHTFASICFMSPNCCFKPDVWKSFSMVLIDANGGKKESHEHISSWIVAKMYIALIALTS